MQTPTALYTREEKGDYKKAAQVSFSLVRDGGVEVLRPRHKGEMGSFKRLLQVTSTWYPVVEPQRVNCEYYNYNILSSAQWRLRLPSFTFNSQYWSKTALAT